MILDLSLNQGKKDKCLKEQRHCLMHVALGNPRQPRGRVEKQPRGEVHRVIVVQYTKAV